MKYNITIGFPKMNKELGEKGDFLPDFVEFLYQCGAHIVLEHGYGKEMGFTEQDYNHQAQGILFSSHQETYQ